MTENLIKAIEKIAYQKICYDQEEGEYDYPDHPWDIFEDGADYGETLFARTLLEMEGLMDHNRIGESEDARR
jgi:hypothetical protein